MIELSTIEWFDLTGLEPSGKKGDVLVWTQHADGRGHIRLMPATDVKNGCTTAADWRVTHWADLPMGPPTRAANTRKPAPGPSR